MQGLLGYTIRRLLWVPLVLLVVSFLTFTITRFGPGDYVTVLAGPRTDPAAMQRLRHENGLDDPFYEQYGRYMKNLITEGDFGTSFTIYRNTPVWDIIWPRILVSIQPGIVALVISITLGVAVGLFAALKQGTWLDPFSISSFLFFQSIPVLISIPFLVLFFVVKLGWIPAIGWGGPSIDVGPQNVELGILTRHIILPSLAMSLPGVAGVARLVRATTLSVLNEDYVRTARAKGLPELQVITRHVARNALLPLVTLIGLSLVGLLEGAIFVENLLGIPGVGQLLFRAATSRDYDVILALVLITSAAFVLANIVIDIAYTFVDPRVRFEESGS